MTSDVAAILSRLETLERQVARIMAHLDLSTQPDSDDEPEYLAGVRQYLHQGQALNAIRHVIKHTNMSLKEAKDLVDKLIAAG